MLVLTRKLVFGVFVYFDVMGKSDDVAPLLHDGTSTTAQLYPVLLKEFGFVKVANGGESGGWWWYEDEDMKNK
ncbi:hypothetical protein Tco_0156122 [Tanacetum coccineum]